jgi:hypothetical protein
VSDSMRPSIASRFWTILAQRYRIILLASIDNHADESDRSFPVGSLPPIRPFITSTLSSPVKQSTRSAQSCQALCPVLFPLFRHSSANLIPLPHNVVNLCPRGVEHQVCGSHRGWSLRASRGQVRPTFPSLTRDCVLTGPCRYLVAEKQFSRIEVFEQRDTAGGIWTYSPLNVIDDDFTIPRTKPTTVPDTAIHVDGCDHVQFVSPIYEFLETNIPHTLMNYSDQKFPEGTSLFPGHAVVKTYLNRYADDLRPILCLSTQVLGVHQAQGVNQPRWEVELLDLKTKVTRKSGFDAVMVASGHYNDPFIPDIPGLAEFSTTNPGSISHSKFYRSPSQYQGKVRETEIGQICRPSAD